MTKLLLLNEVQLQQKLANTSPQAAPAIFGYDDNKFIISMEALDEEIYQKNRKIPDYTQCQMVALVKLFDQAGIKRKDGNKRNYMSKGLRTYAIDVGMDENLKDGDTNKVKDVFFSRDSSTNAHSVCKSHARYVCDSFRWIRSLCASVCGRVRRHGGKPGSGTSPPTKTRIRSLARSRT